MGIHACSTISRLFHPLCSQKSLALLTLFLLLPSSLRHILLSSSSLDSVIEVGRARLTKDTEARNGGKVFLGIL